MFPLWMVILFPFTGIIAIGLLLIACMTALWVILMLIKVPDIKSIFKKTFIFVWLSAALSAILCGIIVYMTDLANTDSAFYEFVSLPLTYDPLDNFFSFFYMLTAVLLAFALIYVINRFVIFRKRLENKSKVRLVALLLAVLTSPWVFLIPTGGGNGSNHIVWQKYGDCEVFIIEDGEKMTVEEKYNNVSHTEGEIKKTNFKKLEHYFYLAVITADKTNEKEAKDAEYTVIFRNPSNEEDVMPEFAFWEDGGCLMFEWKGSIYRSDKERSEDVFGQLNWR